MTRPVPLETAIPPAFVTQGEGDVAVVMLHGVGGGKEAWPSQMDALAGAGFQAVAWDMPGYGESPTLHPYDMRGLAVALARMLDALPDRRIVLLGHSMGGMIAQEAYAAQPARIAGLILSGTSPAFGKPEGQWQQQFLAQRFAPLDAGQTMRELAASLVGGMIGPDAAPEGVALAKAIMGRVPAATYRAALRALMGFDRRAGLADIRVPTLVLAGEHDTNAPPPVMEKMAVRIPDAEYRLLAGVGHLACMEQPRAFNAAVLDFLHRHFSAVPAA